MAALQVFLVVIAALCTVNYMGKYPWVTRKFYEIVYGKTGCIPVKNLGNVTIHYFKARGRGDGIRLMLEEAQIPYNEINFDKDSWPGHKVKGIESGLFTFGQVPAIETTTGVRLVQSLAIMHYIGRATGMDCNCEDYAFCEVVTLGTEDVRKKLGAMVYNPGFKLSDREEYLSKTLPLWLAHFEKLAPRQSDKLLFFASDRLTWVDFLVFDLLDVNMEFANYDLGPKVSKVNIFEDFPKLKWFYEKMKSRSNISNFLRSSKRLPYKLPVIPKN